MNKCSYVKGYKCIKQYDLEEHNMRKTAGVADAVVNFMTLKMQVEFEEGAQEKAVMKEVLANCKKVEDDCEIFFS